MADAVQGLTQRIVALLDAGNLETEDTFEIVEFAGSPYYLQFANHTPGEVVVELVSDEFLPKDARLGKDAGARLDALGWHAPSKGVSPNWFRWVRGAHEAPAAASAAVAALVDVYDLAPEVVAQSLGE